MKKYPDAVIKVTGPGGCINFEIEIIKRALEAYGVRVEVINDAPEHEEGFVEEIARRMKGDWSGGKPDAPKDQYNLGVVKKRVVIEADHLPWGG